MEGYTNDTNVINFHDLKGAKVVNVKEGSMYKGSKEAINAGQLFDLRKELNIGKYHHEYDQYSLEKELKKLKEELEIYKKRSDDDSVIITLGDKAEVINLMGRIEKIQEELIKIKQGGVILKSEFDELKYLEKKIHNISLVNREVFLKARDYMNDETVKSKKKYDDKIKESLKNIGIEFEEIKKEYKDTITKIKEDVVKMKLNNIDRIKEIDLKSNKYKEELSEEIKKLVKIQSEKKDYAQLATSIDSIPQAFEANQIMVGLGVGGKNKDVAFAGGLSYITPNIKFVNMIFGTKISIDLQKNIGWNIGTGVAINIGDIYEY